LDVGALKVHDTVSTTVPGGCSTVIVADVNISSSMLSVQLGLGHAGAPGIASCTGGMLWEDRGLVKRRHHEALGPHSVKLICGGKAHTSVFRSDQMFRTVLS
jgi:hypothetical protein